MVRTSFYHESDHETRPAFLVARVTPALSRSCRLAIDLPLLGVVTWLCGGARRPRRGMATPEIYRRLRQVCRQLLGASDRQLGGSMRRLWRAGLVTVDAKNQWRPCWKDDAMLARIDVALWERSDVTAAAKRVHAVAGHRIAGGRSDAARWLGKQCGMQRGRIAEAMAELEQRGVVSTNGRMRSKTGTWRRWKMLHAAPAATTGTQSEGVPQRSPARDPVEHPAQHRGAAAPMTRLPAYRERAAGAAVASTLRLAGSERVTPDWLAAIGVATARKPAAAIGPIDRYRSDLSIRVTSLGYRRCDVAAWLIQWAIDHPGRQHSSAAAALCTAARRGDLASYVKRTNAERHLAGGDPAAVARAMAPIVGVADAWRARMRPTDCLRASAETAMRGREVATTRAQLDQLDALWRRAPQVVRVLIRGRYAGSRRMLTDRLTELQAPLQCPPPSPCASSLARTAGSP